MPEEAYTHIPAELPRADLRRMVRLVRTLHDLSRQPAYRAFAYAQVPEIARFDPGHDAVMMGYDFHRGPDGPRLIEINTNAGGVRLSCLAAFPNLQRIPDQLPASLKGRGLAMFLAEFKAWSQDDQARPRRIAIIDEEPAEQFLYPEMEAFARLFSSAGIPARVVDPVQLEASADGVFLEGEPVDMVYNRHCDFYLEAKALAGLREAYLAKAVCLSPNPHMYGLLGDKRRLVALSEDRLPGDFGLSESQRRRLHEMIPATELLADLDLEQAWQDRKEHVFKPVTQYGSKGAFMGKSVSRKRFEELPPAQTIMQEAVPPSLTEVPDGEAMKTEFRLFAYRQTILGLTARLYRGQVTNMRTPGGGFAPVALI